MGDARSSRLPIRSSAQQRGRHITVLALHVPRVDYMLVLFQKDEADSLSGADCDLPIGALEVGTGDDAGLVRAQALVDPTCDRLQPVHPVGVIEWAAGTHFLDIRRRMEIIALLKRQPRMRCNSSATVDLPLPETPSAPAPSAEPFSGRRFPSPLCGNRFWLALSTALVEAVATGGGRLSQAAPARPDGRRGAAPPR